MKQSIVILIVILSSLSSSNAQQAVEAYAKGDDTYLLFSESGYSKDKKYVLFNFWNEQTPTAALQVTEFASLKQKLAPFDNVEFVEVKWNSESDIQNALEKYQIEAELEDSKRIELKGEKFTLTTSAANAFLLVENTRASIVCSGSLCGEKIKQFFSINSGQ